MMLLRWGIIDAFYHERLGAVLICSRTITVIGAPQPTPPDGLYYLRSACDGDPDYLETLAADLQERWVNGDKPTFSAN